MQETTSSHTEIRLRNIPSDLKFYLEQEAKEKGKKLTAFILNILEERYLSEQKRKRSDFWQRLEYLRATHNGNKYLTDDEVTQLIRDNRNES